MQRILTLYHKKDLKILIFPIAKIHENHFFIPFRTSEKSKSLQTFVRFQDKCKDPYRPNFSTFCIFKKILTSSEELTIRIWKLSNSCQKMIFQVPSPVSSLLFAFSNKIVISASADNSIRFWIIFTKTCEMLKVLRKLLVCACPLLKNF